MGCPNLGNQYVCGVYSTIYGITLAVVENQVPNGNMEIVNGLPGQPGCVVFNAGCASMWGLMPGSLDQAQNRTVWTDGRGII